jgi:hypothetical protein
VASIFFWGTPVVGSCATFYKVLCLTLAGRGSFGSRWPQLQQEKEETEIKAHEGEVVWHRLGFGGCFFRSTSVLIGG